MSIFNAPTPDQVFRHFTHKGWFLLCPVYLNSRTDECTERRFVPEWWFTANLVLFAVLQVGRVVFGLEPWPDFLIWRGARIGHGGGNL